MISHKYKVIFIHIPKCAGSSIEEYLGAAPFNWKKADYNQLTGWDNRHKIHLQHATAQQLREYNLIEPEVWDSYFKFSFVRNPWERAVSDYYWMLQDRKVKATFEEYLLREGKLKKYLAKNKSKSYRGDHLLAQHQFILNEEGNLMVDFVGRFENLEEDFKKVCELAGIPTKDFPHSKKSNTKKPDILDFYTPERKELFFEFYKKDLEIFNYPDLA